VYQCYGFPGVMIGNTFQVERFTWGSEDVGAHNNW
jgi:hypothetical protein